MKHFRLLTLCLIIFSLTALVSCDSDVKLDTPRGISVEYETLTLKWSDVDGAKMYNVCIVPEGATPIEVTVSKNYYSLESLLPGKYSITVSASDAERVSSSPSKAVTFTREAENGLLFRLIDGEYEVSGKGTATGTVEIPATYRNKPVTSIGEKAFFNESDLTEIIIPESIESIGAFAFANCSYLKKINLPASLSHLGESAFSGCRGIAGELVLPNGITNIPDGAFAYCSSIEEIRFGENLVSIGENAFTDCSDIKSIVFPDSLKVIGNFAFAACADVTEISFGEGLETLGNFAFSKALSVISVALPDSLKTIGQGAFYHCSALSDVELGSGVVEIGDSAFLDTDIYGKSETNEIYIGNWFVALKDSTAPSINIKPGTVGIANSALYANQYITSVELPNSVERIGTSAFAVSNIVSIVTGSGVKSIADQAFLYCEKLIDVALGSYDYVDMTLIDSSLETIGDYAFMNCARLERIEIPDTVKDIGAYAFRNTELFNSALTGAVYADNWIVDFNKTITEDLVVDRGTVGIARYAFYNCSGLKSIKIDNSVKYVCKGAFYNCTALEKVAFPDTLARIEDYAFYNCTSLKLVSLPPMLREIGRAAFYQCGTADNYTSDTDSDKLEIPSGVTYIGDFAFFGCGYRRADSISGQTETAGIDIIVIGDGVEYIGKCAFRGFSSLKSVIISGAAMIGEKAFYECGSLESVTVGKSLVNVGDKAFYRCENLKSVTLADSVKSIGKYAFYKCTSLADVYLGKNLELVGDFAFYGNSAIVGMTVPETVISIGNQAFRDCTSLASLTLGSKLAHVGSHAFYGCDALTLYAKAGVDTSDFDKKWNSTYVPIVFECETSDGYVISVTVDRELIANNFTDTVLSAPAREGYVFLGWSTDASADSAEYSQSELLNAPDGAKLYAVWDAE